MTVSAAASNDVTSELDFVGELHCDLRVDDLDLALMWYRETLGFEVIHHIREVGWAELRSPVAGVRVGLTEVERMPAPGGGAVLTFGVENVDAARAILEEKGVAFDGKTGQIDGWVRLATLFDPAENALMLYQDLEAEPQP
jgi:predicted enzyme related to lactoylglutathione lyase